MTMNRRRLLAAACAALALPSVSRAQGDKPVIRILLGLPPGAGTDAIARVIADRLPAQLGQPVIVENKVGAGGRLAADAVAAAAPDGLTWMIAPNATPTFQTLVFGHELKWNLWRDFAPVAGIASYPLGMAVATHTGASNVREFVAWVKQHPAASFGTPGLGGQNHFLGVQFARSAGITLPVVPYKGTPPLIGDLVGGHVPAAVTLMDQIITFHRSGRVRVIGIFSDRRFELMPDIPTMAEQGVDVPAGEGWTAMWAPAKTPPAAIARMEDAVRKVLALPEVRETLTQRLSVLPHFLDAQAMAERQRKELAAWEPVIKASGFKPQ